MQSVIFAEKQCKSLTSIRTDGPGTNQMAEVVSIRLLDPKNV